MSKRLKIDELKEQLSSKDILRIDDLLTFYRQYEPNLPKSTVSWRIYALVEVGVLHRVGKGLYRIGEARIFIPELTNKMIKVGQLIHKSFPYVKFCVWELASINNFSQHLINYNVLFVDVERDVMESVYYGLKDSFSNVMLVRNLYSDLSEFSLTILVRPLVTDSPIQKIKKIPVTTLEKMLVDLYTDKEFLPFQGNEIYSIYETAFENYSINESTMLRYARRKEKREKIEHMLKTINRQ